MRKNGKFNLKRPIKLLFRAESFIFNIQRNLQRKGDVFFVLQVVGEIQQCPKNEKNTYIYNKYTFSFSVSRARILGDRDVLVQVGSDINLTCRAEESPEAPAAVVWYKNEERVDNLLARSVQIYVYLFNLLSPNRDLFTFYQLLFNFLQGWYICGHRIKAKNLQSFGIQSQQKGCWKLHMCTQ